jgi:hypothetical protein
MARMLTRLFEGWIDPRTGGERFVLHEPSGEADGDGDWQDTSYAESPAEDRAVPLTDVAEARLLIAVIVQSFRDLFAADADEHRGSKQFFSNGRCDHFAQALGLDPSAVMGAVDKAIAAVGRPASDFA